MNDRRFASCFEGSLRYDRATYQWCSSIQLDSLDMDIMAGSRIPKKAIRFSLRTLLLLTGLACVFLGTVVQRARNQRMSVKSIQELGGQVVYDFQQKVMDENSLVVAELRKTLRAKGDGKRRSMFAAHEEAHKASAAIPQSPNVPSWLRRLTGDEVFQQVVTVTFHFGLDDERLLSASDLRALSGFPNLETLSIIGPGIDDASVADFEALKSLKNLRLQGTDVTDAAVEIIASMTNLQSLVLADSYITDESMSLVSQLRNLEQLDLSGTIVGDDGIGEIQSLDKLKRLSIRHTAVTDAGLAHLSKLNALQFLDCGGTRTTTQAVFELENKLNLKDTNRTILPLP